MEAKCYFAKESPKVEVRGGLVFIQPIGSPCEIAVSPSTLRQFILHCEEALAIFRLDGIDRKVVPLRRARR